MPSKIKKLLQVAVSIGLISYLICKVNVESVLLVLRGADLRFISIVVAILFVQGLISTLKWFLILSSDGVRVPYLYLMVTYTIGSFLSMFLPTNFGGDIYRVYALKEYQQSVARNTSSVLFDRLTGLFALVSIPTFTYIVLYADKQTLLLFAVYIVGILLFLVFTSDQVVRRLISIKYRFGLFIVDILLSFNRYRKNYSLLIFCLTLAFIFQHNTIWVIKFYCMALSIDIHIKYLYIFVPLIYLAETIPISIGGLGVRESAIVFFFYQAGVHKDESMALAVLVISVRYAYSMIVGGGFFILRIMTSRQKPKKLSNIQKSTTV